MKPFERLGEAVAPDGTRLALYRHDGDYTIRVDGVELMSTRRHASEDALATLGCDGLVDRADARVLIGGLGLGFTLRAALGVLPADARVVVVELLDEVIRWNRDPDWAIAVDVLADPRTELRRGDVAHALRHEPAAYDAILLDVDNGAEAMTTRGNRGLYSDKGVRTAIAALRPGGRLAYWAAVPEPAFVRVLRRNGLTVEEHTVRARAGGKGAAHVVYVATPR